MMKKEANPSKGSLSNQTFRSLSLHKSVPHLSFSRFPIQLGPEHIPLFFIYCIAISWCVYTSLNPEPVIESVTPVDLATNGTSANETLTPPEPSIFDDLPFYKPSFWSLFFLAVVVILSIFFELLQVCNLT
jgi:hypothetical protein